MDTANVFEGDEREVTFVLDAPYSTLCLAVGVWDLVGNNSDGDQHSAFVKIASEDGEIWADIVRLGTPISRSEQTDGAGRITLSVSEAEQEGAFTSVVWASPTLTRIGDCSPQIGEERAVPAKAYLEEMDAISGPDDQGPATIDLQTYARSVTMSTANQIDDRETAIWYLGRDYGRFCATAGIPSDFRYDSATAIAWLVLDEVSLEPQLVTLSQPGVFDVDVSGVLQLTLVIETAASNYVEVAWGDALVTTDSCG